MHCQCVRECVVLLVCPINVRDSVCRVWFCLCTVCVRDSGCGGGGGGGPSSLYCLYKG